MSIRYRRLALQDNGGRRMNIDRRQFSYTDYIPDRRSGNDRRSAMDRRSGARDQRSGEDRRVAFLTTNEHEYTRI